MNEATHDPVEEFLATLRTALHRTGGRPDDIVEEVRGDLNEHIRHHRTSGASEAEAVERALAELGNPYELAHHIQGEAAPFGGATATAIRYLLASGLILWTLVLLWIFRAWSYGLEGLAAGALVTLIHLPPILLLWPRIVWRRNWLFGLIPAGAGLLVALFLAGAGTTSSQTFPIPEQGSAVAIAPDPEPTFPTPPAILALASGTLATAVLLLAMQQRRQRRNALIAMLLPVALAEGAFQIEEAVFRQELEKTIRENAKGVAWSPPRALPGSVWTFGEEVSLFWSRPLCPGFSIHYTSQDGRIRIQD